MNTFNEANEFLYLQETSHFVLLHVHSNTPDRRLSKTLILSLNHFEDKKSLETEFSIVICRLVEREMAIGNTVSRDFFYPRSSIVKSVFNCHLSGVKLKSPAPV